MFFTGSQAIEKDIEVHMLFNNKIRTDFRGAFVKFLTDDVAISILDCLACFVSDP